MTLLTIGVPTYRGADRLERLFKSLEEAITGQAVEVIVCDDGSPDGEQARAREVVEGYAERMKRVNFMGYPENKGAYHAYNVIVRRAEGKYVCLLDDDVLIPKWWLESLLFFVCNNIFAVASWKSLNYLSYHLTGYAGKPERATELAGYCFCFPRELWEEYQFDEGYKCFIADSDFCVRWAWDHLPSYRILWPLVYHEEHATYDSCPELEHAKWRGRDVGHFKKKWGMSPREAEKQVLGRLKPQKVRWLTAEGPREA